jgi:hypothetical protein
MHKSAVLLFSMLFACGAFAQDLVVQELIDAHKSAGDALNHLGEANARHAGQFGGHEGKARELIQQALHEIEAADRFFHEHPKPPR